MEELSLKKLDLSIEVNNFHCMSRWYESILRKCVVHLWLLHFCQELDSLLLFHIFSLGNTQGMLFVIGMRMVGSTPPIPFLLSS